MVPYFSVIIVTHNSQDELPLCLDSLGRQDGCILSVIVVDSGSDDSGYLRTLKEKYEFTLIETSNVGFSRANNLGFHAVSDDCRMVVFQNPDTLLPEDYLLRAFEILQNVPEAAVISGVLAGYDLAARKPTQQIDSTGVFRHWYGRWYDRDQGRMISATRRQKQFLPAVCGALFACRMEALRSLPNDVFDPDFFLYKEDIELSIRLRKKGWKLLFDPTLQAFHGRGWGRSRRDVSLSLRRIAAKSEVLLYKKHPSPYMLWAFMKYLLVNIVRI
jgi:GT2 family glycosyltransferase